MWELRTALVARCIDAIIPAIITSNLVNLLNPYGKLYGLNGDEACRILYRTDEKEFLCLALRSHFNGLLL